MTSAILFTMQESRSAKPQLRSPIVSRGSRMKRMPSVLSMSAFMSYVFLSPGAFVAPTKMLHKAEHPCGCFWTTMVMPNIQVYPISRSAKCTSTLHVLTGRIWFTFVQAD